ncbi:Dam family site-specific DNA-(adenine-N6)-methyltransferase [Fulvimonas sp. R45]|uniref:DNA adenine methylase n=1 Tax=Fulvimonas sp. R45 TaxID=3045937 RepID=UPI00265DCBB5|nr:Dam family site-specific DNA-(adenine-N6)-methyltransferase [Fulvimonas sp. R45]MDO1527907.1 Dam family site-specific DNA-(adenine-N6)-methyltransferase [Fulvimonas sp. R45]
MAFSESKMPNKDLTPFLKWAGGKRWLARDYVSFFNMKGIRRYVEPFLGSGAVFFSIQPESALLSDLNIDLVETYRSIRDNWQAVKRALGRHHKHHSPEYYYKVRSSIPKDGFARAARFIYLNRTCFNGLYRVNCRGEFNVPLGTKTSVILDTDDFGAIADRLARVELVAEDFEKVIDRCGVGDFIFADPPYTVKHNNNGFVKYNENLFSWADQERLQCSLARAARRGARVIVSNADHPSIRELYNGCSINTLWRHSVMASESARRKVTSEVLVQF